MQTNMRCMQQFICTLTVWSDADADRYRHALCGILFDYCIVRHEHIYLLYWFRKVCFTNHHKSIWSRSSRQKDPQALTKYCIRLFER
jgi:hypothetical protein